VIWAIDASLKWQPGFRAAIVPNLAATAAGEPHWPAPWFDLWLRLQRPDPSAWAYLAAVTETLLAACVLLGVASKLVYAVGAAYALIVWSTADGFGAAYGPGATDIGPAVIYSVVFCALLTTGAQGSAGRYSLDALIARRVAWWHRLGWGGAD
jgi:nitrite reductase (NO-forming)